MKVEDLRIDNYVNYQIGTSMFQGQVTTITKTRIVVGGVTYKFMSVQPIPLTEEWLIKFGYMFNNCYYLKDDSDIEFFKSNGKLFCEFYGNWFSNIEYVHDLQNLHFAIYKEELKIK